MVSTGRTLEGKPDELIAHLRTNFHGFHVQNRIIEKIYCLLKVRWPFRILLRKGSARIKLSFPTSRLRPANTALRKPSTDAEAGHTKRRAADALLAGNRRSQTALVSLDLRFCSAARRLMGPNEVYDRRDDERADIGGNEIKKQAEFRDLFEPFLQGS